MRLRTYRMFQAMILTGLGFFLLHRFWSGQLIVYVHRRFIWLVLIAALGLIVLAQSLFNNRPPIRSEVDGLLVDQLAPAGAKWRLMMMFLPLLLGILVPVRPLGAESAESRQVSQSIAFTTSGDVENTVLSLDPSDRSLLEWLWVFDITKDTSDLVGQPVNLEGFVLPDENLPEGQFLVARFIVTCCVADATAIGLAVEAPDINGQPFSGWVRVKGTMQVVYDQGKESLLIEADDIQSIPEPSNPYLYQ